MDTFNIIEKYYKLMKGEKNFNYKYNPILYPKKNFNFLTCNKLNDNLNGIESTKILSKTKDKLIDENKHTIINNETKEKIILENNTNINVNKKKIISKTTYPIKLMRYKKIFNDNFIKREIPNIIKNNILDENYCIKQFNIHKGIQDKNHKKIKGFFIKSHCPFCRKKLEEEEENKNKDNINNLIDSSNNMYRNKKFKDIRSCFMYSVNNFPLIHSKNSYFKEKLDLDKEKYYKTQRKWKKKIDMESELTKNNKIIKFKEIQRKEIDPKNLYLIKKPLIPSIRGKILKNTKKRIGKPMRMIVLDENDYIPFEEIMI